MEKNNKLKVVQGVDTSLTREEVEQKAHDNQVLLNDYQKQHGTKVLTRRDFMASGLISFSGTLMSQSLFSLMMPQTAEAASCMVSGSGQWVPLVTINLQGGSNLSSHFLPRDQGGQPLASYTKLGWGLSSSFSVDTEFSNQTPFFGGSTLLTGIRTSAAPATLASTAFVGVPVQTQDDSSANPADITGLARGMGLNGKILANIGTANTGTGNGTMPAFMAPPAPLVIGGYEDITGALGIAGSLQPLVSSNRAGKMFQAIQNLSIFQAKKYALENGGSVLENVITCRTNDNTNLIANPNGNNTDPRGNAQVAAVWNIDGNTAMGSQAYQLGSMVFNALNGNAGSCNINLGGYDYHDGTRTRGDQADNRAGLVIGQVLQTAAVLGTKVFIMVTTDGGTSSPESQQTGAEWTSDNGGAGCYYMLAFNPAGAPSTSGNMIGYMNSNQSAASPLISSPDRAAAAVFINWLSFNGQINRIDQVLPRTFNPDEITQMTKIA